MTRAWQLDGETPEYNGAWRGSATARNLGAPAEWVEGCSILREKYMENRHTTLVLYFTSDFVIGS